MEIDLSYLINKRCKSLLSGAKFWIVGYYMDESGPALVCESQDNNKLFIFGLDQISMDRGN